MKKIVFLVGPPCSGKGTLCSFLNKNDEICVLSAGNAIRRIAEEDSSRTGKIVRDALEKGELVPDDVAMNAIIGDVKKSLDSDCSTIIFDGLPRSYVQAKLLLDFIDTLDSGVSASIVLLEANDDILFSRLMDRMICSNADCQAVYSKSAVDFELEICEKCNSDLMIRKDDTLSILKSRLDIYKKSKEDILKVFDDGGVDVFVIESGNVSSPQTVFKNFNKVLSKLGH